MRGDPTLVREVRPGLRPETSSAALYNLRCQLVHAGSSRGGLMNRASAQRCAEIPGYLMPAFLVEIIDHGAGVDWVPLCYPPITIPDDTTRWWLRNGGCGTEWVYS